MMGCSLPTWSGEFSAGFLNHRLWSLLPEVGMWNLPGFFEMNGIWYLGGGFKYFLFSPLFGEDSHFDWYFSDGLKPPSRIWYAWTTEPTEPMIRHASFIRTRRNYDFKDFQQFPIDVFDHAFFQKRHHKITLSEEHQIGRDLFASNSQVPPLPTSPQTQTFPPNPPDPQEMIPSSPSTSAPTRRP